MQTIKDTSIIKAIEETPMLSSSATRLLEVSVDSDCDIATIIDIIKHDSALTARLLKIVNSAAYNLAHPVESVNRAIACLGIRTVVAVAIADSADEMFMKPLNGYDAEAGSLGRHELYCAVAARTISRYARSPISGDLAFTAGLLHDIGKAIISEFLVDSPTALLEKIESGATSDYRQAEESHIGLDHSLVGYELARRWKLPSALQNVIAHHHRPSEAPADARALTYAVHVGDILSMMAGYGTGSDSMQYRLDPGYENYFTLDANSIEQVILEANEEFKIASHSFDLERN